MHHQLLLLLNRSFIMRNTNIPNYVALAKASYADSPTKAALNH